MLLLLLRRPSSIHRTRYLLILLGKAQQPCRVPGNHEFLVGPYYPSSNKAFGCGNTPRCIGVGIGYRIKLDAKPKYVVSTTRRDYSWENTIHVQGDLREAVQRIKEKTPAGVLVGSLKLGAELQRLDLIDEYRLVVHPILAGHGPRLFDGLAESRQLERVSVKTFKGGQTAMHFRRRAG